MNNNLLDNLGTLSDFLQVINFIENEKQAKDIKHIYEHVDKIEENIQDIENIQKEILKKLNFLLDKIK